MTDRNKRGEPICEFSDLPTAMCAHCSGKTSPSDPVITIKPRLTPLGVAARTSDGEPTWHPSTPSSQVRPSPRPTRRRQPR